MIGRDDFMYKSNIKKYQKSFKEGGMRKVIVLGVLLLVLSFVVQPMSGAEKGATKDNEKTAVSEKSYPPYPDVWDREYMTQAKAETYNEIPDLLMLSNGDVLYLFYERVPRKDRKDDYDLISHQVTFFGGQTVVNAKSNLRIIRGQQTELELIDGTMVSIIKEKGRRLFGRLKLSNGVEIDSGEDMHRIKCYHGPVRSFFSIGDEKDRGDRRKHKVIFTIRYKPKQYIWDIPRPLPGSDVEVDPCTEEGPPGYSTRVDVVWGTGMIALDDGTFLLPMDNGLIVRFDEHFKTKSSLLNRRFFVFDFEPCDFGLGKDTCLFIDQINGKKYNLEKTGYQPVYDDLYKYLDNIRRK
jgi:hypothetical protein